VASGSQPKKDAKTPRVSARSPRKTNAAKSTSEDMDISANALAFTSASRDSSEFSKLAAATSAPSSSSSVPNSWEKIGISCQEGEEEANLSDTDLDNALDEELVEG
jgi:hypothetical protein